MHVCTPCEAKCPERPEVCVRASGTGVTGGYDLPDEASWDLNLGPLKEQQVLLTTELSLVGS